MSAILAVLCFAVFSALNYEFVDGGYCVKPAIHLDGKTSGYGNHPYKAGKALSFWDLNSGNSIIEGDMDYSEGAIIVPYNGTYYVYCQLFYRLPNNPVPKHGIRINGKRRVVEAGSDTSEGYEGSYNAAALVKMEAGDQLTCLLSYSSNLWDGTGHSFFGAYML